MIETYKALTWVERLAVCVVFVAVTIVSATLSGRAFGSPDIPEGFHATYAARYRTTIKSLVYGFCGAGAAAWLNKKYMPPPDSDKPR